MDPGVVLGGKYRLSTCLGSGGMGEVWAAHDEHLDRPIAVKILLTSLNTDPVLIARLRQEARTAGSLQHPGIAMVHVIGNHDGHPYFVMELLDGRDLGHLLAEYPGGMPVEFALGLMVQVADALAYAHRHGVVHRDIKPENLIRLTGGGVKICDFGIARYAEASPRLTAPGGLVGTPRYMAPEQCEGRPVDARSDLYSFGATLHALLVGESPFPGPSPAALLRQHIDCPPPHLRTLRPGLPDELDDLLQRLLAKKPADRPEDAGQVRDTLRAILAPRNIEWPTPRRQSRRAMLRAGLGATALLVLSSSNRPATPTRNRATPEVTLRDGMDPATITFSPDGTLLASQNNDGTISLWNVATHHPIATLTDSPTGVGSLRFSPDGKLLVGGNPAGAVSLWNVATGKQISTLKYPQINTTGAIAFDQHGAILASNDELRAISLWNVATRKKIGILTDDLVIGPNISGRPLTFSPDGAILAGFAFPGLVELWDVASLTKIAYLTGAEAGIINNNLTFSPDGKFLAAVSADEVVHIWDSATHREIATLHTDLGDSDRTVSLAFNSDGKILAGGTSAGSLLLWDVANSRIVTTLGRFTTHGSSDLVSSVAFSPTDKILAAAITGRIGMWTLGQLPISRSAILPGSPR